MRPMSWMMRGGLDLVTPRISRSRQPGGMTLCINHEAREEGYRRIDGIERYDGRPAPSSLPHPVPEDTAQERADKVAAIEALRDAIDEVPGQGELLGVWRWNNETYAFSRKDAPDADEIGMFVARQGWEEIDLGHRFHFNSAAGAFPLVGTVVSDSSQPTQTATIRRVVRLSGDLSASDAAGFCVVDNATVGELTPGNELTWVGKANTEVMRIASAVQKQSIAWGEVAYFRFDNENLFGREELERMYFVSGTDYGWEYDGTIATPLITGRANDAPRFIAAHQKHIFMGYHEGSVVHSALGEAVNFEAIEGAAELGAGEVMTDMVSGYRNSLFIFGRNQSLVLQGTSVADWRLFEFDDEAGSLPHTAQLLNEPTVYDDRGIRGIQATDAYGDFSVATTSNYIRPLLDRKRRLNRLPTCSTRVRAKSQYRLWFDDGDCIVFGLGEGRTGRIYHNYSLSRFELDGDIAVVTHACSNEDDDGREIMFVTIQGKRFVYQLDKGINFDGQQVRAIMQCPFNDDGQAAVIKKYKKLFAECDAVDPSRFQMSADFDDGKQVGERVPDQTFRAGSGGGRWDEDNWSEFVWGGEPDNLAEFRISGRGRNIAPLIYTRGDDIPPYVISGMTVMYLPLRYQK